MYIIIYMLKYKKTEPGGKMKLIIVISTVVFLASLLCGVFTKAQALDVNAVFGQLKSELLQKGMSTSDIKAVEPPVKNMLSLERRFRI